MWKFEATFQVRSQNFGHNLVIPNILHKPLKSRPFFKPPKPGSKMHLSAPSKYIVRKAYKPESGDMILPDGMDSNSEIVTHLKTLTKVKWKIT